MVTERILIRDFSDHSHAVWKYDFLLLIVKFYFQDSLMLPFRVDVYLIVQAVFAQAVPLLADRPISRISLHHQRQIFFLAEALLFLQARICAGRQGQESTRGAQCFGPSVSLLNAGTLL